jgi:XTP/dITP diphosphohydrolase
VTESERPLQRAVEVMDRLRSPGGCPWDASQTHESLTRYLLEEAYEVIEAIETGDRALLREELGDLLLQVLFHCRIEQESALEPFGIDEVAADLVAKLVRRHPHVFGDASAGSAAELNETWERQKVEEKGRTSAVDGVPVNQPALALAAKLISRARRFGVDAALPAAEPEDFGTRLFAVAAEAVAAGVDPEAALRVTARHYRARVRAAEHDGSAEKNSGR